MRRGTICSVPLKSEDSVTLIKWCRANLGARGVDWDFSGGLRRDKIDIYCFTEKALFTLRMWKDIEHEYQI